MSESEPSLRLRAIAALLVAVAGAPALAAEACLEGATEAIAADVPDARSITLSDGRTLRLAGIEPFDLFRPDLTGAEAALREHVERLVEESAVTMRPVTSKADRYGRLPALVAVEGVLLQERLAEAGLAIAFAGGDLIPCFARILAAEDEARESAKGYWAKTQLPAATPEALGAMTGRFAIFESEVLSVGNRYQRTYLNFGTSWSRDVTVEIARADRDRHFGGEAALAALAGKNVRVRGYVEEKSGPMIAVRSVMQLEVLSTNKAEPEATP